MLDFGKKRGAYAPALIKEEFVRDAVRHRLKLLRDEYETIEILKEDYEKANHAVKEMSMPHLNAATSSTEK